MFAETTGSTEKGGHVDVCVGLPSTVHPTKDASDIQTEQQHACWCMDGLPEYRHLSGKECHWDPQSLQSNNIKKNTGQQYSCEELVKLAL